MLPFEIRFLIFPLTIFASSDKDFGSYLGDQFAGTFLFKTGASGDTVEYALYSDAAANLSSTYVPVGTPADAEQKQIDGYKAGQLVGVHPQYPAAL